jgi:hypothetical protein
MIAECAQDLFTKIQAITSLAASTGLAAGGKAPDPGMANVTLPAAWIMADEGETTLPNSDGQVKRQLSALLGFSVMLYVPYLSQSDLITNQLPLLQKVIHDVHGTDAPTGERWQFKRYKLRVANTDRLGYQITFLLDSAYI